MINLKTHLLTVALLSTPLYGKITLAPLFQDGAVLQRDKEVPVWGLASPGLSVQVSFGGQTKSTKADASGRWQLSLAAMSASAENRTMTVTESGSPSVEVKNLWVGEVWLASGQSNMQYTIAQTIPANQAEAAAGPIPLMRLFQVPRVLNHVRQDTLNAQWTPTTPETAKGFSAVAYFFGKRLAEELKVPIGLIHSSWGGSKIEPWWAEEGLVGIDELKNIRTDRLAKSPGFPAYDQPYRRFVSAIGDWSKQAENALDRSLPVPPMPNAPELLKLGHAAEAGTYQAMIHPLVPYGLRGFLWYQGESNNGEGMLYTTKMQALIAGWRKQFRDDAAPFLFVQLAPYNYGEKRALSLPEIWVAQQKALLIPHTGMAVTNDIATVRDIHPPNKGEVGRRLALWALADTYGQKNLVKSGPLYSGYKVTPEGIQINFSHVGTGLVTRDGKMANLFEIAGFDDVYQVADVKISSDGKSLLLSSMQVPKPDRARFAWTQMAEPNLMNREGLPAAAFNTHWPIDPSLGVNIALGKKIVSSDANPTAWNGGLTDGVWGNAAGTCYATGNSAVFPKSVTIDLEKSQEIHAIFYGAPDIGSTKTVAIQISEDGTTFKEVKRTEFPVKQALRAQARFEPQTARFVRATFIDYHQARNGYEPSFGFLSEVEVYAP
jgi:sialate O-acetylesterase